MSVQPFGALAGRVVMSESDTVRAVFEASYRRLVGQLYGVCGDLTEAEEVVAEAFARAVQHQRSFTSLENPEAWLRTVAVNVSRTEGGPGEVWIIPRDGGGARVAHRETPPDVDGNVHTPVIVDLAWSPDGSRLGILIAHSGADWVETGEPVDPSDPRPRLIVVPATGGEAQTLHTFEFGGDDREAMMSGNYIFNWAFAWSPDGQRIALTHHGGVAELSATEGTVLVEHSGVGDSGPLAWLPE